METFFLGVIAFSMLFIAVMSLVRTIFWIIVALKVRDLIKDIQSDYKQLYPKVSRLIDNISGVSGLLGFFKMFKFLRGKK
ncbi:hypothetical protein SULAZ_1616 [Sulfurihydrogenibium azorense Az-Fu1]|uniref:Uncharacterized protein n=1 Tax=Sulfurihydrogenibium azorense (strain DSM 15241 / OCM 825 / Az-Fu1) TaxID=204536 RepID=C1DWU2_SULAA|nr:hypothetical protein [Sulfurihydrogenibium azorense]ACN99232.1 hypothetical protein SULAZ_1616 [Sulfurihydrogenibium azorense Az-Fu1]